MKKILVLFSAILSLFAFTSCSDKGGETNPLVDDFNEIISRLNKFPYYKEFASTLETIDVSSLNVESLTILAISDNQMKEMGDLLGNDGILGLNRIKQHIIRGGYSYEYLSTVKHNSEDEIERLKLKSITDHELEVKVNVETPYINGIELTDKGEKIGESYLYTIGSLIPFYDISDAIVKKWKYDKVEYSFNIKIPGMADSEVNEIILNYLMEKIEWADETVFEFQKDENAEVIDYLPLVITENNTIKNGFYLISDNWLNLIIGSNYYHYLVDVVNYKTNLEMFITKDTFYREVKALPNFPIDIELLRVALNATDAEFLFKVVLTEI